MITALQELRDELDRFNVRAQDIIKRLGDPWQPRATAPRDGTEVLLYVPAAKCIAQATWTGTFWKYDTDDDQELGWNDGDFSHWHPMPEPPGAV